jgi:transcriptional regulator with GAF, ATPase, and Fis domain
MLVRHFAQQFARRMKKPIETISTDTMDALTRYDWPGNIRELQNLIERAVILSTGPTLDVPVTALNGGRTTPTSAPGATAVRPVFGSDATVGQPAQPDRPETLEEADRRHIIAALERTNWVIAGPNGAAVRLGIKRSTLQFRMRKLGIVRRGIANR